LKISNPEKETPSNDRWYSIYKKIVAKNDSANINPKTAPPVAAPPVAAPPMTAPPPVQPQPVVQQPPMAPQPGYVNTGYTQYPPGPYQNTVAPAAPPGPYMPVPPAGPPGFVPNTEYYVGRYGHKGKTMKVENATYTGVRVDCQEDFCKDCSKKVSEGRRRFDNYLLGASTA